MTDKPWDTWDFQDRLLSRIDGKSRYRKEHEGRIARKQSNGSPYMRDQLTGEITALEALLGGAMYPTAEHMRAKIEALLSNDAPPKLSVEHQESYQQGWTSGLTEMRGALAGYQD